MQTRRLSRLVFAAALVAVAAVGCGGASKAGDGVTSPPSTSR